VNSLLFTKANERFPGADASARNAAKASLLLSVRSPSWFRSLSRFLFIYNNTTKNSHIPHALMRSRIGAKSTLALCAGVPERMLLRAAAEA